MVSTARGLVISHHRMLQSSHVSVVFTCDQLCPFTSSRETWGNWRGFYRGAQGPTEHVLEREEEEAGLV